VQRWQTVLLWSMRRGSGVVRMELTGGPGGRIWATVNERRGATFHFTLPMALEESTLTVSEM